MGNSYTRLEESDEDLGQIANEEYSKKTVLTRDQLIAKQPDVRLSIRMRLLDHLADRMHSEMGGDCSRLENALRDLRYYMNNNIAAIPRPLWLEMEDHIRIAELDLQRKILLEQLVTQRRTNISWMLNSIP